MLLHPISVQERFPIGSIIDAYASPGSDWMLCNGDILAQADYPNLFELMDEPNPNRFGRWQYVITLPYTGLRKLAFNGTKWVGFTSGGHYVDTTDGENWNNGAIPNSYTYYGICWNGTNFVGLGYGSNKAIYSSNGTSWIQVTLPVTTYWRSPCWNGTYFIAVAYNNINTTKSLDGITWTAGGTFPAIVYWESIAADPVSGRVVAGGNYKMGYSDDNGTTWKIFPSTIEHIADIQYFSDVGLWVFIGSYYNTLGVSEDGINWEITAIGLKNKAQVLAFGDYGQDLSALRIRKVNGYYIIFPDGNDCYFGISKDLKIWEPLPVFDGVYIYDCIYINDTLYVINDDVVIKSSFVEDYDSGTHFQLPYANHNQPLGYNSRMNKYIRVR